jgi:hypothetical protein
VYRLLEGTPEGKRPLGRRSRLWENNVKMCLLKKELATVDHILLVQGREKLKLLFAQ